MSLEDFSQILHNSRDSEVRRIGADSAIFGACGFLRAIFRSGAVGFIGWNFRSVLRDSTNGRISQTVADLIN